MDRKRIMLTNKEILAVKIAILNAIRDKEKLMKLIYGDEVHPEAYIVGELGALKSALNKLDAASYGKKGKE